MGFQTRMGFQALEEGQDLNREAASYRMGSFLEFPSLLQSRLRMGYQTLE